MQCKYCGSSSSEVRRRTVKNGAVQIVEQCLTCGSARSNPIRKDLVRNVASLPAWDDSLAEQYSEQRHREFCEERERQRNAFLAEHSEYLRTPEWRKRRALVMARANGLCEGCREQPATQVHHLTYRHWKNELLWELVAVCDACHERAHEDREDG